MVQRTIPFWVDEVGSEIKVSHRGVLIVLIVSHMKRPQLSQNKSVLDLETYSIQYSLQSGKRILVVAHGTSLRGVVKYVNNLDEETINKVMATFP